MMHYILSNVTKQQDFNDGFYLGLAVAATIIVFILVRKFRNKKK